MRIISQLVPDGKPVSTDIEATRKPGVTMWEIPAWGRPLALGVYPFFVTKDRRLFPIGTAFCISKLGVSLTALHNIHEAVRRHWRHSQPDRQAAHHTMSDIGMALFHHHVLPEGALSGNIWSLEFIDGAPPTDVGYVFPKFHGRFPYLPLPISFAVPRIGSRIVCVGFGDLSIPDAGLPLEDIQCGRINLLDAYKHNFLAVEGRVTRLFTQRFANGFIGGPCYTIDAEIKNGMCGGPVFSEDGYVCGVISAGATNFFGEPTSIISLLYPALAMNIRCGGQIGPARIKSNRRLFELIKQGAMITDGSENLITIRQEGDEFFLGPAIHGGDVDCIYDDLSAFRGGHPATQASREVYRIGHRRRMDL